MKVIKKDNETHNEEFRKNLLCQDIRRNPVTFTQTSQCFKQRQGFRSSTSSWYYFSEKLQQRNSRIEINNNPRKLLPGPIYTNAYTKYLKR